MANSNEEPKARHPYPGATARELKLMRQMHASAASGHRARLREDRDIESINVSRRGLAAAESMLARIDAQIAEQVRPC